VKIDVMPFMCQLGVLKPCYGSSYYRKIVNSQSVSVKKERGSLAAGHQLSGDTSSGEH